MDKGQVVLGPERLENAVEVATRRVGLRLMFIHDEALHSEDSPHPVIHLAPLFGVRLGAGDSSETREEPLRHSINRVRGRPLRQPRRAR